MEEIPKILCPEVLDVLPGFANMLDLKSFMHLAMSCKDMYKHCINDKGIRINVTEKRLEVICDRGRPKFAWHVVNVSQNLREQYLAKLQQLPFNVTLERVYLRDIQNDRSIKAAHDHLIKINVKRIIKLQIDGDFVAWTQLVSFVEKFQVRKLKMETENVIPADVMLSLLQLQMDSINFKSPFPIAALLKATSPIPKLKFSEVQKISGNDFMQLLWSIQTGALLGLSIDLQALNLDRGKGVPYDFEGPLPDDRPLMFYRERDYWFLHWHGGVTKGVTKMYNLNLFKCGKSDYPPVLREEEEVLEDMDKEMTRAINYKSPIEVDFRSIFYNNIREVSCPRSQFLSFSEKFPMIGASHQGPLPTERPLYCKVSPLRYWLFNVNDVLVECKWDNGYAKWKTIDDIANEGSSFGHPALEKYLVRRSLQNISKGFTINCKDKDVFESWFEGFTRLPMGYDGILPDERPLLFEGKDSLILLSKEGCVCKCFYIGSVGYFAKCPSRMLPPILMKKGNIEDLISTGELSELELRMDLEIFRSAFDQFKTFPFDCDGPFPEERPVIITKTQNNDDELVEERLIIYDHKEINATWKNGRAAFKEADKREFSPYLTESLLENLLKAKPNRKICRTLFVDLETIEKYLALFKALPYDYGGPIPDEDVVVFTKTKIKNDGRRTRKRAGDSTDVIMTIWMLKERINVSYATYGAKEPRKLEFNGLLRPKDVPPALKTKERLKQLILKGEFGPDDASSPRTAISWFGGLDDLLACLNEFTELPYLFDDDLPEERPLVFEVDDANWVILREDGSRLVCSYDDDDEGVRLFTSPDYDPPVLELEP